MLFLSGAGPNQTNIISPLNEFQGIKEHLKEVLSKQVIWASPQHWGCRAGYQGTGFLLGSSEWAGSGSGSVCHGWWWWCLHHTCQTGDGLRDQKSAWRRECQDLPGRLAWHHRSEYPVIRHSDRSGLSLWETPLLTLFKHGIRNELKV